jgi:hypothetical protein
MTCQFAKLASRTCSGKMMTATPRWDSEIRPARAGETSPPNQLGPADPATALRGPTPKIAAPVFQEPVCDPQLAVGSACTPIVEFEGVVRRH